ncbi:methyltransferase [Streptomyces sp. Y1]|uniref:Methyltransferase n=1 Tax=Streptomyces sp. Y1 TaxID=3238634 RepID=A0AB39TVY2_9ACTN
MTNLPETDRDMPSPVPLMQLTSAFWQFKTLAAGVETGLFTELADGQALTREDLAARLDLRERPADMFLAALTSLGLLTKADCRYRNSPLAEEFLVEGRPRYFGGLVRYCDQREYPAWHRIVEALRTDKPLTWDPATQDSLFGADDQVMTRLFWEAMHSLSMSTARTLGEAYDFGAHRRLLDVGGGSGAFPIVLCQRYPQLSATVVELDHVCGVIEQKAREAGVGEAVHAAAGDFLSDASLPPGHDVILLSNVLHDWDETTGRKLLAKCYDALEDGGAIILCELMLDSEHTGPANAALMGMNMIVSTEGGQSYSADELTRWLTDTGFEDPRTISFEATGANGAVVARKNPGRVG